jgi:hypothetical protein
MSEPTIGKHRVVQHHQRGYESAQVIRSNHAVVPLLGQLMTHALLTP